MKRAAGLAAVRVQVDEKEISREATRRRVPSSGGDEFAQQPST